MSYSHSNYRHVALDHTLTELVMILDRSGSMKICIDDTIGGFNEFLEKQKQAPGKKHLSLVLFDDRYELVHNRVDINHVAPLTKEINLARGMTALRDAVGKTVNDIGYKLHESSERPGKVIVVIITDGQENSSKEFSHSQLKEMIKHQQDKYSWEFIFMGANQDSWLTAEGFGIKYGNTFNYTYSTTCDTMSLAADIATHYSTGGTTRNLSSNAAVSSNAVYLAKVKEEEDKKVK